MAEMQSIATVGQQLAARLRAKMAADGLQWPSATTLTPGSVNCERCHDLGFVALDVPMDDPRFGKLLPCTCALGREHARKAIEARTARYCVQLPQKTFVDFKRRGGVIDQALLAAQRFAENPQWCMVLWGPSGTGKTHLVAAAANQLRERGVDVGFFTAPDLLDMLRSGFDRGDYDALLEALKSITVLCIDDLGAEKGTEWANEKFFQIINARYNKRMALLVAMNDAPDDVLEGRLADRLCDVDWSLRIKLEVSSWRRRKTTDGGNGR